MWFVFELVIWPQEVTLAIWTQPSGPLCLWQCLVLRIGMDGAVKKRVPHHFNLLHHGRVNTELSKIHEDLEESLLIKKWFQRCSGSSTHTWRYPWSDGSSSKIFFQGMSLFFNAARNLLVEIWRGNVFWGFQDLCTFAFGQIVTPGKSIFQIG